MIELKKALLLFMPSPKSIVRRCYSQTISSTTTQPPQTPVAPAPSPVGLGDPRGLPTFRISPGRAYPVVETRDAAVQCTLIRWSPSEQTVLTEFSEEESKEACSSNIASRRRRKYGELSTESSSLELSVAATNGSGATLDWCPPASTSGQGSNQVSTAPVSQPTITLGPAGQRGPLNIHSAPPTRSSTRVEQLLLEHYEGSDSPSLTVTSASGLTYTQRPFHGMGVVHSEPDIESSSQVRCCATAALPRVAALRDQFKRREAITLSDSDVELALNRVSDGSVNCGASIITTTVPYTTTSGMYENGHCFYVKGAKCYHSTQSLISSSHGYQLDIPEDAALSASDLGMRSDTLISPRISPLLWLQQCLPSLVVTPDIKGCGSSTSSIQDAEARHLLGGRKMDGRSGSGGEGSEHSEEGEGGSHSPSLPRRGRRQAIFDSKSLALINQEEEEISPSNSCDESETSNLLSKDSLRRRKRSSADLGINYPGDLLSQVRPRPKPVTDVPPLLKRNTIGDFAHTMTYQASSASLGPLDPEKKLKNTFSLRKLIDKKSHRSKDNLPELSEIMRNLRRSEFKDSTLMGYKNAHWMDLIASTDKEDVGLERRISECERKRREAVWELFKSECVFLIDHLMVLKHCFMEPMKKVQVEGYLMFTEPQDLYGNLDELCYVSYTFSRDFVSLLLKDDPTVNDFGRTPVLIKGLKRFAQLTRNGEVYHDYCLNYSKAITYLEHLRRNEDFSEFEKWCSQDVRCHRLQLTDLLISPMQHCTKLPLLLNNIRRYTDNPEEQQMLTDSIEKLETSINDLEAKMLWLKNYERVQEIQQQIIWQPITELEPRAFIPEFLRMTLTRQPCEKLLTSPRRQLLCEGPVTLLEISKAVDMYMFLFDDILLLTKIKKATRRKATQSVSAGSGTASADMSPGFSQSKLQTDGIVFVVHRQPIALDRFIIHDVRPPEIAGEQSISAESSSTDNAMMEGYTYHESCLPHFRDDCNRQSSNLLFGCLSTSTVLTNAFVLVQVSRFQQIIGVFTVQTPSESSKEIWLARLQEAQDRYKHACKRAENVIMKGSSLDSDVQAEVVRTTGQSASSPLRRHRASLRLNAPRVGSGPASAFSPLVPAEMQVVAGSAVSVGLTTFLPDDETNMSRKIRSCSSDAATTTTKSLPIPRRISDPTHRDNQAPSSSSSSAATGALAAAVQITTRALISGYNSGGQVSPLAFPLPSAGGYLNGRKPRLPSLSRKDSPDSPQRSAGTSLQGSPCTSTEASPTAIRRCRHMSLRVRRTLKSVGERSMSTETFSYRSASAKRF